MRVVKYLIYIAGIIFFVRSQIFGTFLVGANKIFSDFGDAISGNVSPQVIFFLIAVLVFLAFAVYSAIS